VLSRSIKCYLILYHAFSNVLLREKLPFLRIDMGLLFVRIIHLCVTGVAEITPIVPALAVVKNMAPPEFTSISNPVVPPAALSVLDKCHLLMNLIIRHNLSYETNRGSGERGLLRTVLENVLRRRIFFKNLQQSFPINANEWHWCGQRIDTLKSILVSIRHKWVILESVCQCRGI